MTFQLEPGVVVAGRYRLERRLGEGGMGVVWAARHTVTLRAVALKFLKEGHLDTLSRKRFVREARASAAIQHPGIVPVHDVIESEAGAPALVMDLLEGESLGARLDRDGKLPLEVAVPILLEVLAAVGAAHAVGVVHRDLKPENIFLTREGPVRILDFGVAKVTHVDADTARSAGTQTGALLGTPVFMAPEQAFGEKDIDHRADVWALGLVAYECLTGVLPTTSENLGQVLKIILTGKIRPIRELEPSVPEAVAAAIDRMLSRDREARPGLGEVAEALAHAAGLPAPAIPEPVMGPRLVEEAEPARAADTSSSGRRARLGVAQGPDTLATSESDSSASRRAAGPLRVVPIAAAGLAGAAIAAAILIARTPSGGVPTVAPGAVVATGVERGTPSPPAVSAAASVSASSSPSSSAPLVTPVPSASASAGPRRPGPRRPSSPFDDKPDVPKAGELDF